MLYISERGGEKEELKKNEIPHSGLSKFSSLYAIAARIKKTSNYTKSGGIVGWLFMRRTSTDAFLHSTDIQI